MSNDFKIFEEILNLVKENIEEKIMASDLENKIHITSTHQRRIFRKYSKLSLMKYRDRIRLIGAVKYILAGNSMKDAAIKYNFTEQGLSTAFKREYGVNIRDLKNGNVEIDLYKNLEISVGIKKSGKYTYECEKWMFNDILYAFEEKKFIEGITGANERNNDSKTFTIKINIVKLVEYINKIGRIVKIDRSSMESILHNNSRAVLIFIKKDLNNLNNLEISIEEFIIRFFISIFFYNLDNPVVKDNKNIYIIDPKLEIIIDSIEEIKKITRENIGFDINVSLNKKSNRIILEIPIVYKIFLNEI